MKKPNIIMIMTDDHGYWALGCAGNKELHTPNLDRLASKGILFNNFFCASPVCSPARASVFTGKIPSQHGVHDWISGGHANKEHVHEDFRKIIESEDTPGHYQWAKSQLKDGVGIQYLEGQTCFTEVLAQHGYTCGLSGKWHLGDSGVPQAGFTYWETLALGGDHYYHATVLKDGKFVPLENQYVTDYITDRAIDFLEQQEREVPFYLSVHYTAPHAPWEKHEHPAAFYEMYENCPFESVPDEPAHPWSIYHHKNREEEQRARRHNLTGYYAAMSAMDQGVGELLDYLEAHNLMDDTIIFFTGDNGMSMGHHGIFGKGNGTYPVNMYDTAVKVPAILCYPRGLASGQKRDELLSHYDLMPTLLDYLGLTDGLHLEQLPGRSFLPLLKGEAVQDEAIVIMDEYGPTRMIRTRDWKYIHRYPYGEHELYHIGVDPDEAVNLIGDAAYESQLCELRNRLNHWYDRYVDPRVDGSREAVTGNGQLRKCGLASEGKKAFI
ncbi:MAG: sulfatase-like hydrolase/transferase [Cellulosilyticaceae bacterium]